MDYYPQMMNGNDGGYGIVMMLFWFVALLVIAFVVMRLFRERSAGTKQATSPIDIAKQRYAKGELKKDEFEQLVKDLK